MVSSMSALTTRIAGLAFVLSLATSATHADTALDAYKVMGLQVKDVLSGTSLSSKVMPGEAKQFVTVTTYFTGNKNDNDAVNVRLDVFERNGGRLQSVYSRNFGDENGGYVGAGNLQIIDLDLDGVNEIIVSYDNYKDPLIQQTQGEVILWDDGEFTTGWSDLLAYDATRAAREIPVERRDRFVRELDFVKTLRTRGVTLFIRKHVIAVAGERLPKPKTVEETFPLRSRDTW
jgi:hypothetical protein